MREIFKVVIAWSLGLLLLSFLGGLLLPKLQNSGLGAPSTGRNYDYYLSLAQWDGGNYIQIAQSGYVKPSYYAFSPAYPFLINIVSSITSLDLVLSGLAVSISAFFAFIFFLYKYTFSVYGKRVARTSIFTFLFFPTTFFCILIYSESFFLFFMTLSIYALDKKMHLFSIVAAAVLPLVRYIGIFLILGNLYKSVVEVKNVKLSIAHAFAILPLAAYLAILFAVFDNPLFFVSTQNLWSRFALDPISTVFLYFAPIFSLKMISMNNLFDLLTTLLFFTVLIKGFHKLQINVWIFSVLAILIPASSATLTGMPRYALVSIGFFIIVGDYLANRPKLKFAVWSAGLALQAVLFSLFITGHWIA